MTTERIDIPWIFHRGGRIDKVEYDDPDAKDCLIRSIAIASGESYSDILKEVESLAKLEYISPNKEYISSAKHGVYYFTFSKILHRLKFKRFPLLFAKGKTPLALGIDALPEEMLQGNIIVALSGRHFSALVNGIFYDMHDPVAFGYKVHGYYKRV